MSFMIAHASDSHLASQSTARRALSLNKQSLEDISWALSRGRRHDMRPVAVLSADLRAQKPDHVVVTGDAVNVGRRYEYDCAAAWLASLGERDRISYAPGNHDMILRSCAPLMTAAFDPWIRADDGSIGFPYLRRRGEVAIIGMSSAVATAPFMATGTLGEPQLERLAELLGETGRDGMFRIILVHHPPYRTRGQRQRGLVDWPRLQHTIAEHGAELVLHGHDHWSSTASIVGEKTQAYGAPSLSAARNSGWSPAGYHLYRIERQGRSWSCDARVRLFDPSTGAVYDGPQPAARGPGT